MSPYFNKRTFFYIIFDILAVNIAFFLAYYFRLGSNVTDRLGPDYFMGTALATLIFISFFFIFRFYRIVWTYASYEDYFFALVANLFAGFVFVATQVVLKQVILSLIILATILAPIITVGGRVIFRVLRKMINNYKSRSGKAENVLVIGYSEKAMQVAKNLKLDSSEKRYPVGILGIDNSNTGRFISGVMVHGTIDILEEIVLQKKVKGIIVVPDDLTRRDKLIIFRRIRKLGLKIEIAKNGENTKKNSLQQLSIKQATISELFGKEDIEPDMKTLCSEYNDKNIFIAGAAGLIGRRISEVLSECSPKKLILLDINENGLQDVFDKIKESQKDINVIPVIASLNNIKVLEKLFEEEKPDYVIHAAFLNRSDLSEKNPEEVVKNNVSGTYHLVETAQKNMCKKVLMISSNMAKEPNDLVSATKRICEMMFQGANQRFITDFAVIRFPDLNKNAYFELDNFKKTLEKSSSIEIVNPNEKKYIFAYADASTLIIKSLSMLRGGETFVLYPGESVTVEEIANSFINYHKIQSGSTQEIKVTYKNEENKYPEEPDIYFTELNLTEDENIYLDRSIFDDYRKLTEKISNLELIIEKADYETAEKTVLKVLKDLVPDYQFPEFDGSGHYFHRRDEEEGEKRIWLSSPHMGGLEQVYVKEAFDTNWIAPIGPNITEFEKEIANYTGAGHVAAMVSGTAAIHIALRLLKVNAGDEIFCSSLTFAGSTFPILYENAIPVFVDSEPESWNMSPKALENAFKDREKSGKFPKAVIVVNLYGQSTDFEPIVKICEKYNVPIIEDAAESLGATYKGRQTGTFGKFGVFSFNGNKIITTSGGGVLVSDDEKAIKKARFLITQAKDPARYYQHSETGYNYRMSNVVAGIGRGQLKVLDLRISQKKEIFMHYKEAFGDIKDISMMPVRSYGEPNYWLSVITLEKHSKVKALDIILALEREGIESRPVWKPLHLQPVFKRYPFYNHHTGQKSVAKTIFDTGVCLPSDTKMTKEDLERICSVIKGLWNE